MAAAASVADANAAELAAAKAADARDAETLSTSEADQAAADATQARADYRFFAVKGTDTAPEFFAHTATRYGHRVYGGILLTY